MNPLRADGEHSYAVRAPGKALEVVVLRPNDGLVAVQYEWTVLSEHDAVIFLRRR